MSDSVKKYYEMVEDGILKDTTLLPKPNIDSYLVSEGHKKEAYTILCTYQSESIIEAARILKSGN